MSCEANCWPTELFWKSVRRLLRVESKWPRRLKRAANSSGVMEAMGVLLAGMVVTQWSLLVRRVCCVLNAHKM